MGKLTMVRVERCICIFSASGLSVACRRSCLKHGSQRMFPLDVQCLCLCWPFSCQQPQTVSASLVACRRSCLIHGSQRLFRLDVQFLCLCWPSHCQQPQTLSASIAALGVAGDVSEPAAEQISSTARSACVG